MSHLQLVLIKRPDQTWGFRVASQNNKVVVSQVSHGSPAQLGGVRVGDQVHAMNGIMSLSITNAEQLLGNSHRKIILQITRASTLAAAASSALAARQQEVIALDSDNYSDEEDESDDDAYYRNSDTRRTSSGSGARPSSVPTMRVTYQPGEVVDLISSDDEAPPARARAPSVSAHTSTNSSSVSAAAANITGSKRASDTDRDSLGAEAPKRQKTKVGGVEVKQEFEPKKFGEANCDDEVIELMPEGVQEDDGAAASAAVASANGASASSSSSASAAPAATGANASVDDDELDADGFAVVGGNVQMASQYPHQRYSCTVCPYRVAPPPSQIKKFQETPTQFQERCKINLKHCPQCYCYVCDANVTECSDWKDHCHATHKESKWKADKEARNTKLTRMMSAARRTLHFSQNGTILRQMKSNTFLAAEQLSIVDRVVNEVKKCLADSRIQAPDAARDNFLVASELLITCLVSSIPKDSRLADLQISWLLHPQSTVPLRNILGEEVRRLMEHSYAWSPGTINRAVCKVFSWPESVFSHIKLSVQQEVSGAEKLYDENTLGSKTLESYLKMVDQTVINMIVAELVALGSFNFAHAVSKKGSFPKGLMFATLAQSANLPAMVKCLRVFLAEPLTWNTGETMAGIIAPYWKNASKDQWLRLVVGLMYRAFHGDTSKRFSKLNFSYLVTIRSLFSVVFEKAFLDFDTSVGAKDIEDQVDVFISAAENHDINNIADWFDKTCVKDGSLKDLAVLAVSLFILFTNRSIECMYAADPSLLVRKEHLYEAMTSQPFASYSSFPVLCSLANAVYKHLNTAHSDSRVNLNILLSSSIACFTISKFARKFDESNKLCSLDQLNPAILESWQKMPLLRRAKPGDICPNTSTLSQTEGSCFVDDGSNHVLMFCAFNNDYATGSPPKISDRGKAACPSGSSSSMLIASSSSSSCSVVSKPPCAHLLVCYCGQHYNHESFMKSIFAGKLNVLVGGHRFDLTNQISFLVPDHTSFFVDVYHNPKITSLCGKGWVNYLVAMRVPLRMMWKSFLLACYDFIHSPDQSTVRTFPLENFCSLFRAGPGHLLTEIKDYLFTFCEIKACLKPHNISSLEVDEILVLHYNMCSLYEFVNVRTSSEFSKFRDVKQRILNAEKDVAEAGLNKAVLDSYMLDSDNMSMRAVWHFFWRSLLVMQPRMHSFDFACTFILEDWSRLNKIFEGGNQLSDWVVMNFFGGVNKLDIEDLSTMNYAGVSGCTVLKNALEKILCSKDPVIQSNLSKHFMVYGNGVLAHLLKQVNISTLIQGAKKFVPVFVEALQSKMDIACAAASEGSYFLASGESLEELTSELHLVNAAFTECVQKFVLHGNDANIRYTDVLRGCVALRRYDLVNQMLQVGFVKICGESDAGYPQARKKIVGIVGLILNSRGSLQDLLVCLDVFKDIVAEMCCHEQDYLLLEPSMEVLFPDVVTKRTSTNSYDANADEVFSNSFKMCSSAGPPSNSSIIDLPHSVRWLRFMYTLRFEDFKAYWEDCSTNLVAIKESVLRWLTVYKTTSYSSDQTLYLLVAFQVLGRGEFCNLISSSNILNENSHNRVIPVLLALAKFDDTIIPAVASLVSFYLLSTPFVYCMELVQSFFNAGNLPRNCEVLVAAESEKSAQALCSVDSPLQQTEAASAGDCAADLGVASSDAGNTVGMNDIVGMNDTVGLNDTVVDAALDWVVDGVARKSQVDQNVCEEVAQIEMWVSAVARRRPKGDPRSITPNEVSSIVERVLHSEATAPKIPYNDARVVLLFLNDASTYSEQLAALCNQPHFEVHRSALIKLLLNTVKSVESAVKLLLRLRDFSLLFAMVRNCADEGPRSRVEYIKFVLDQLTMDVLCAPRSPPTGSASASNLSSTLLSTSSNSSVASTVGGAGGSSSISVFAKELFAENSFVVQFVPLMPVLPETVHFIVKQILQKIATFTASDSLVMAYIDLFAEVSKSSLQTFYDKCKQNLCSVTWIPPENSVTTPSRFFVESLKAALSLSRKPQRIFKMCEEALEYFKKKDYDPSGLYFEETPNSIISRIINAPCLYRAPYKSILWIPVGYPVHQEVSNLFGKIAADNTVSQNCMDALVEPVLLRLLGESIDNKCDSSISFRFGGANGDGSSVVPLGASSSSSSSSSSVGASAGTGGGGSSSIAEPPLALDNIDKWAAAAALSFSTVRKIVENLAKNRPLSFGYLEDIVKLFDGLTSSLWCRARFSSMIDSPHKVIIQKLLLHIVLMYTRKIGIGDQAMLGTIFTVLSHRVSNNEPYFPVKEGEYILQTVQVPHHTYGSTVRRALMLFDVSVGVSLFEQYPQVLSACEVGAEREVWNFSNTMLSLWAKLLPLVPSLKETIFSQVKRSFLMLMTNLKSERFTQYVSREFESTGGQLCKFLFDNFPDKTAIIKDMRTEGRAIVKSKPAVLKLFDALFGK
jgi:hypothetical protein